MVNYVVRNDHRLESNELHKNESVLTEDSRIEVACGEVEGACVVLFSPDGKQDVSNIAAANRQYLDRFFARAVIA